MFAQHTYSVAGCLSKPALVMEWASKPTVVAQIEVARLYKDAGVNPLAGCLPTLVTLPVWIGLYRALSNVADEGLLTEGFFWIPSLAGPTSLAAQKAVRGPRLDCLCLLTWFGCLAQGRLICGWLSRGQLCASLHPEFFSLEHLLLIHKSETSRCGQGSGSSWLFPLTNGAPPIGWHDAIAYLVLPVLLIVSQYASQKIISPPSNDPSQKSTQNILRFLPLMIGALPSNHQPG